MKLAQSKNREESTIEDDKPLPYTVFCQAGKVAGCKAWTAILVAMPELWECHAPCLVLLLLK